jgi:hypothetical protein
VAISFAVVLVPVGAQAAQVAYATIASPLDTAGNVKVHEQGTANVNVANTVGTESKDTTSLLYDGYCTGDVAARTIDTSHVRTIRVLATNLSTTQSATLDLIYLNVAGYNFATSGNINRLGGSFTAAYDVPPSPLLCGTEGDLHMFISGRA